MLKVLRELEPTTRIVNSVTRGTYTAKKRLLECECECGKICVKERSQVISGKTKSCGCLKARTKHGMSGVKGERHKLYSVWASQKSRCRNPNDNAYSTYGDKGIKFSKKFNEFADWFAYVTALPNAEAKGYSIDRTNNDKGYKKGNLRWVNRTMQQCNRGKERTNKSGYKGVHIMKHGKYRARVQYKGVGYHIGCYDTASEAGKAYNDYIIANLLPHNLN